MRWDNDTCCKESQKNPKQSHLAFFLKEIEEKKQSDVDNCKKLISINL